MIKITEYHHAKNRFIEKEFNKAIEKQVAYLEGYFKSCNYSSKKISKRHNYILSFSLYDYHLRESMLINSSDEFLDVVIIIFSLSRNNFDGMGETMVDSERYEFLSPTKKRMLKIEELGLI